MAELYDYNPENKPLARPKKNINPIRVALPVVICLCIVLAVVIYSHRQMEVITSFAEYTVQELGDSAAVEIESTYGYAVNSIKAVAAAVSENMTSPELEDPSAIISPLIETTPFGSIEYIRPDGMNVMNIGQPFDASTREYYINGIKGISGVWNNYHPKIAEETLMNFYTPLMYHGNIAGVITGYIRATSQVSPLLESKFFSEDTQGLLYDRQGMVICSSYELEFEKDLTVEKLFSGFSKDDSKYDAMLSLLNAGVDGIYSYYDNDGEGRVYIKGIDATDWVIAIFIPAQSFNAVIGQSLRSTYVVVGMIILLAAAYVIFIVVQNRKESRRYAYENAQLELENKRFNEQNAKAFGDLSELNAQLQLNQQMLQDARDQAEAANKAKTSFLFNMSHDIRTPMNAILGYTRMLQKDAYHPEKVLDYQKKLQKSGDFLLDLINGVLEMSRIESGHIELNEEYFHTGSFLQDIADVFENVIREKNLTVICKELVQAEHIMLDAPKTHEIISNLIGNAIKYTPAGGTITAITTELPSDREGYVLFQTVVEDNGIGMSEEFLPHVFDAFARERNTTTAKIAGTGLGLSIVKKLVDAMGGSISVKSKVGVGTTFTMLLYHRIADEKLSNNCENTALDVKEFSAEGKRILLVEDNDLNAEIAIEILHEIGFNAERAEDGVISIDMLKHAEPGYYDLILMDIQMPNMDGYEATRAIRKLSDPKKANIPIIAMTANAFEEDKREALRSGMNGHLAKPINVTELIKTLAGIVG